MICKWSNLSQQFNRKWTAKFGKIHNIERNLVSINWFRISSPWRLISINISSAFFHFATLCAVWKIRGGGWWWPPLNYLWILRIFDRGLYFANFPKKLRSTSASVLPNYIFLLRCRFSIWLNVPGNTGKYNKSISVQGFELSHWNSYALTC